MKIKNMKKIIALLIMVTVSTGVFAQGEAVSKFFAKYATDESFTTATISSKMFSLITNMDVQTPEDKEIVEAISKLKGLKVLGKENSSDARSLYKEAYGLVATKDYEELMSVRDKDKDMKFFIREASGKINELVMVMGGSDDFMMLSIFGEIDLKAISKIGRKMQVDGLEQLEKIHHDDKKKN
jgi:CII-binding regulator of phage lambda lysogenization HflD